MELIGAPGAEVQIARWKGVVKGGKSTVFAPVSVKTTLPIHLFVVIFHRIKGARGSQRIAEGSKGLGTV